MTQLRMFVPQQADDELSEIHNEDGPVDRLLGPAPCRAHMELVFDAVEQLLHTVLFAVVLEGFVK